MISIPIHPNLKPDSYNWPIVGMVDAHATSYNKHRIIRLEPRTFWVTLVSQVAKIITYNSEKLRKKYVTFEGKKDLEITRKGVFINKDILVQEFAELIHENILDKDFKNWILVETSDMTKKDNTVLCMMMMGTFKNYFNYVCSDCGVPEIKIFGNIMDWTNIKSRLPKLLEFNELGYNCDKWVSDLTILVDNCINALNNKINIEYWKDYVKGFEPSGSGAKPYIEGHILALNRFYEKINYNTKETYLQENTSNKLNFQDINHEIVEFTISYNNKNYNFTAGNFHTGEHEDKSFKIEPDFDYKQE